MRLRQWSAGVPAGPSRSRSRTSDHYTCLALDAVSTHLVQVAQTAHSAGQRGPGVPGRILQTADVIALELLLSECEHWRHRLVRLSQRYGCRAQRMADRLPRAAGLPADRVSFTDPSFQRGRARQECPPRCGVDGGELPGHGHGAGVGGIVGHEVHGLHNSNTGDHLNEARFDDVRGRRGLTPDGSRRAPIRWYVATVRHARAESPTA
jgi:hypothetical protein